jgi:hypothetical protein
MLALLICLQVVKCFLDRVCHLNFSSCYPSVWGGFFYGNIMSDRLTIISRSGRVFEMGDCWQVLLAHGPLQKSRSLDRTRYKLLRLIDDQLN